MSIHSVSRSYCPSLSSLQLLTSQGIDVPRHIYVQRQEGQEDTNVIEEFDEYIMINGEQLKKPFVEKPVDADDHNIYIYYPMSAGGGSKRLFRKVQDRSSQHYRKINEVRRVGSYIYEEFLVTQGTDVKVYTVGADYGHAEARKSPVVDGKVWACCQLLYYNGKGDLTTMYIRSSATRMAWRCATPSSYLPRRRRCLARSPSPSNRPCAASTSCGSPGNPMSAT